MLKMTQMYEIAEGLSYLHSLAIIHGDVNHVSDQP
jgi:serine/threonine protein kinase